MSYESAATGKELRSGRIYAEVARSTELKGSCQLPVVSPTLDASNFWPETTIR